VRGAPLSFGADVLGEGWSLYVVKRPDGLVLVDVEGPDVDFREALTPRVAVALAGALLQSVGLQVP
jgi:hypothetical protein